MKFHLKICILCTFTLLTCGTGVTNDEPTISKSQMYPALAIVYYSNENLFALADIQTTHQMNSNSKIEPIDSIVLLTCPYHSTSLELVYVKKRYRRNSVIDNINVCEHQYKPGYTVNQLIGYQLLLTEQDWKEIYDFPIENSSKQTIHFITVMKIKIDTMLKRTVYTEHTFTSYHPTGSTKSCKEYPKGIEGLSNMDYSQFYDEAKQNKWLQQYRHHNGQVFVPHQLVPIDDFSDDSSRQVTCFDANSAPIWSCISAGPIRKIEQFIRSIARKVGLNTLTVETVTNDILQLLLLDGESPAINIYLDPKNNFIPAPKIFMKILHYKLPYFDGQLTQIRHYYIAIVVHNEINFLSSEKVCEVNVCDDTAITKDEKISNLIYCCALDDRGFSIVTKPNYSYEVLNLKSIPIKIDKNGKEIEWVEISPIN